MEVNGKRQAELKDARYVEVKRASEARAAEIDATIERVHATSKENAEAVARLALRADSIELSDAAESAASEDLGLSADRIKELRAAVEDGSLFDRDRIARAAENLLS